MGDCGGAADLNGVDKDQATRLKGAAIAGILIASTLGVAIPLMGSKLKFLRVEGRAFCVAKSFAAGVILSTGFVHILGEASERLQSECLPEMPWHKFPWTGFVAMMSVFLTLVVDAVGTEYYERKHGVFMGHGHGALESASSRVAVDNKTSDEEKNTLDYVQREKDTEHLRHVVISQVLELGIIAHSVIIGISLGVSDTASSIRPLFAALCFHQFFEGIALGGCIAQAGFKRVASFLMAVFFAGTTPVGIAIGIGVASSYNENSQTSLIVQGLLDAVSAGILIYMALVDLIAHDFLGKRMKGDRQLQALCYTALFAAATAMSALAIWA
ncbi:hypothetical protein Mapa_012620 [Marchantia paleacea]|nr:hypothetical protein Mapa_012620 [Marchantia paleacea]